MELCTGGSLADKLEQSADGLPEDEVRKYTISVLAALLYCHEVKNIAHRDIKPENMMLTKVGGEVKVCDFGTCDFF